MTKLAKLYSWISNRLYRHKLRNDNFTIIANSCIAGVMYNKLGKKFLSPTINLWIHDVEFFRFVRDLDYYLKQPLRFVSNNYGYPTAYCGDVMIHFNHYKDEDEAANKWYERLKRINRDNVFIICSDRPMENEYVSHEDMLSLKDVQCKGKVIFSVRQYDDIDYIVPLPMASDGEWVNAYMFDKSKYFHRWRWETAWDWVHWLNTGEVRLRKCTE